MSNPLRSEIVTPIHSYTFRLVAMAVGCGVIGVAAALSTGPASVTPPAPEPAAHEVFAALPSVAAVEAPPVRASSEVQLVFRAAGATYMKLGDADPMPKHGALVFHDRGEADHWQKFSIGTIAEDDVALARGWTGRDVIGDNGCVATVIGFAVVARLTGDPSYAEGDARTWTADSVLANGAPVIAAKLSGCETATLARDAQLSPIVTPTVIRERTLAKRARANLLASSPASAAQRVWEADDRTGAWHAQGTIDTIVVRHPTTNTTWISVHARIEEGCGGPDINVWGLYRVDGDQLVAAHERDLGEMFSIKKLVDIDADGELELIGAPWLGTDTVVLHANGDELTRHALSFFGCAC